MFWNIAQLIHDQVISMDEIEEFSDELKDAVMLILKGKKQYVYKYLTL